MRKEKGITLIALIITIIVLLILAGITIAAISSNQDALDKAKQASDATRAGEILDTIKLTYQDNTINSYLGRTKKTKEQLISELSANGKLTDAEVSALQESDTINIGGKIIDFGVIDNSSVTIPLYIQEMKITNSQIFDCQRDPAYPNAGDTMTLSTFIPAYKTGVNSSAGVQSGHYLKVKHLGAINSITDDQELQTALQTEYPNKDYPVVRLEKYDENNNYVGKYSEGGVLYSLDSENGIYMILAQQVGEANNSFGYVFCTKSSWPQYCVNAFSNGSIQIKVEGIVDNIV